MVRSLGDVSGELTQDGDYSLADDNQVADFLEQVPPSERENLKEVLRTEAQRLIDEKISVDETAFKGSVYSPLYREYLAVKSRNFPTFVDAIRRAEEGRDVMIYGFGEYHVEGFFLGFPLGNRPLTLFLQEGLPYLVREKGVRIVGTEYLPSDIPRRDILYYFYYWEAERGSALETLLEKADVSRIHIKDFLDSVADQFFDSEDDATRQLLKAHLDAETEKAFGDEDEVDLYREPLRQIAQHTEADSHPGNTLYRELVVELVEMTPPSGRKAERKKTAPPPLAPLPVEIRGLNAPSRFWEEAASDGEMGLDDWLKGIRVIRRNCERLVRETQRKGQKLVLYTGTLHNEVRPSAYPRASYPRRLSGDSAFRRDFLEIDILNHRGHHEFTGEDEGDFYGADFSRIQRGSVKHYVLERKSRPHSFSIVIPQSDPDPEVSSP